MSSFTSRWPAVCPSCLVAILIMALLLALPASLAAAAAPWPRQGSLDAGFNPGSGADDSVAAIAVQPDGKVLIAGSFRHVNGVARDLVARLYPNGTLDPTFHPASDPISSTRLYAVLVQPDGKIVIGGAFSKYNNVALNSIARFNPDGSVDATFNIGDGVRGDVLAMVRQPDGKLLVGGWFDLYNGVARVQPNGALDASFDPGAGADDLIEAMVLQRDGKVLIGGDFTSYDNVGRNRIARLWGPAFVYLPAVRRR
jgi:uncharacterized delta-60 repeat protein